MTTAGSFTASDVPYYNATVIFGPLLCIDQNPPGGIIPRWAELRDVSFLTKVEEIEDPVHGVFPVRGMVFQPQDQKLLPADHAQPVHQVHDVQAHLQPDLEDTEERKKRRKGCCHVMKITGWRIKPEAERECANRKSDRSKCAERRNKRIQILVRLLVRYRWFRAVPAACNTVQKRVCSPAWRCWQSCCTHRSASCTP